MRPVRKDLLAIDHPEGAREDALPQVRAQVPVPEPPGHRGGEPALGGPRRSHLEPPPGPTTPPPKSV